MDRTYAEQILAALADGVNPMTGEVLPPDDSCNQPDVIRALHVAVSALRNEKTKKPQPENAGKPWTEADEQTLKRMFENGCSKKDICAYFKRTEGSIAARLVRLGLIQDRANFKG